MGGSLATILTDDVGDGCGGAVAGAEGVAGGRGGRGVGILLWGGEGRGGWFSVGASHSGGFGGVGCSMGGNFFLGGEVSCEGRGGDVCPIGGILF